jgi:hypothetical protein
VGIAAVQFQLDGQSLGAAVTATPYATTWNTAGTTNGTHVLTAVARDGAGNTTTSAAVSVDVSNATGVTKTLGYTAVAATTDSGAANYITAWSFAMPNESGTATSLSIYISAPVSAAPNNLFQVAIYSDVNGLPGALVVSTPSQAIVPNAWNTVPLTAVLQPNAKYWLAYNTNGASSAANNIRLDPGTAGQMRWRAQSFGTWPSTLGAPNGAAAMKSSIYVTYKVP